MSYTIKDIANRAGVSKSTVSRVISGNGYTSLETRQKVLDTIQELHYKPNALARAMVSQRTHNIGVIIYRQHHPIASHPFYGKILDSILTTAESLDYSVFVTTDKEMSSRSADFMLEKRVDGLILISRLSKEVIDYIHSFQIPYLMVNGTVEDDQVIQIVNNDEKGGRLAAEHLFQLGHRQFSIITGPQEHRSHYLRFQSFRRRIEELGGNILKEHVYFSPTSRFEDGFKGLNIMWERSRLPLAIFATNDMLALGAIQSLWEKGVRVPEDMAVMGFDNVEYSAMSVPPLTSIHVEKEKMGYDAVITLDRLIKGETVNPVWIELEPKLVVRKSTLRV
ncbi:LacI family transcriptional regulator [Fodinisporobacter ferrooxydans]|uniref:LacI family transcriptional regulator n=1 Tax=Fodinisporobacter ferrooxydans TaxID=2901836 RepID=A0ABY4CGE9_9BACL|nr:LacI family transcriptional regulator [Alicyclobacillaceae bacterium MYW30-H2]